MADSLFNPVNFNVIHKGGCVICPLLLDSNRFICWSDWFKGPSWLCFFAATCTHTVFVSSGEGLRGRGGTFVKLSFMSHNLKDTFNKWSEITALEHMMTNITDDDTWKGEHFTCLESQSSELSSCLWKRCQIKCQVGVVTACFFFLYCGFKIASNKVIL